MKKIKLLIILIITFQSVLHAETWSEPWQKEIIQKSEYFILGNIIKLDSLGVHVEVNQNFSNKKLSDKILINGFSLLKLRSASGHGVHFDFKKGENYYLLLTKRKDGNFAIPTPTSGFAMLDEKDNVRATYRHSYHQALIPKDIYELTYKAIWNYYHKANYNKNDIQKFIDDLIAKEPAGFEEDEISTFFLQHAALETAYLLDIPIELNRIIKFAKSTNFHSRVSTVQLMSLLKDKETKKFLFEYIQNDNNGNFDKVIAIRSLIKIGDKKYIDKLIKIADTLSDEETGFGGNIMDPRVATSFPSPREAVKEIIE
ncbi:hypothetical protein [Tenacibaculum sp. M341]|uniref:hypothetical protein n=1 Tax=Tenacibaculum sp. M341 TaxID=2530339 RepID=UPI001053C69C|nr:hypothetical protein [Tenacibaculum sp. M341]TCI93149.1 hypothetical protein EYW44_05900 [Tenacibaculum sp. M341]